MKLVVFDLDGTLVDSHAFINRIQTATFEAEGLPVPTAEAGRGVIGLALPEAMHALSGDSASVDRLVQRYKLLAHARAADVADEGLYEGAFEAVQALYEMPDTLLGIATGKGMRGVNRILDLHEMADLFTTFQTPDTNPSKPHPGMLHSAMAETGAEAMETVMIGDTTYDMEMARAAGVRALGVSWGSHAPDQLRAAGAHLIIEEMDELIDAVNDILEADYA